MKRKILMLLIAVCTLGIFSSCEGPAGRDGLDGNGSMILVPLFTVEQADWKWDKDAEVYYYDIPVSQLSRNVANDGEVLVSMAFEGDRYIPLSETAYYFNNIYFSETIHYNYRPGFVTITIGASDLFDNTDPTYLPPTYTFKITLLY